ncbi:PEP-CTERM sorting domain-containing protein [Aquincola tertiaricarbonis]|uniref:PEP-CTERM sorting domain-containing protein n=1 Tax=Aquincola tertiaricarbonis TaxID=391953 RepID=A0ABY4SF48_AQUTE|nr:PEP-CTERM sorting domain-containing protein [Aquincola tertiaricarbonis]URI11644.1 PEP-CTERM sorting domain-containing protein [Aquincola tertiaricarbonis]
MPNQRFVLVGAAALVSFNAFASVSGQATCWVSAHGDLGTNGYQLNDDCLTVVPDFVVPGLNQGHLQSGDNRDETYVSGGASGAVASYALRASYGNLGVAVRATNSSSYNERDGVRESGAAESYANSVVSFDDGLRVRSNSLADGQAIRLELYGRIDADDFRFSTASNRATVNHSLYAYASLSGTGGVDSTFVLCMGDAAQAPGCDRATSGSFSLMVDTFVGAQLRLSGSMSAVAWTTTSADAANPAVSASAWVEAMASLHTQLRSTSDVFVVSESGTNYVSAVPEPAATAMLGVGLVALAFVLRRKFWGAWTFGLRSLIDGRGNATTASKVVSLKFVPTLSHTDERGACGQTGCQQPSRGWFRDR